MMDTTPTMASQVIRPSVRIVERQKMATKATATKMAVQAPCSERALKQIDRPNMAAPAVNTYTDTS